ncbi:MAG: AAA family ATPase [Gammaproteobacteria bacterium]
MSADDAQGGPAGPDVDPAIARAGVLAGRMRAAIARTVVGQDEVIDQVLMALFAGGHVLIEGVPGLGKTLLVRTLSGIFGGVFGRIQFTPDLMPADITGHVLYDMKAEQFRVRKGPVFCNLLLADEINRAPAKTQAALLEVMQEHQVTLEGNSMSVPEPFMVLATQNPLEQEGTYPLPEAQLDRYLLKVLIDYPDVDEERRLVDAVTTGRVGDTLDSGDADPLTDPETVRKLQRITASVALDGAVLDYAVAIVRETRQWPGISVGAGPRGGISLVRAARAAALLHGRDHVLPDDIKRAALPALRHRIALAPELELEGQNSDRVLAGILDKVEAPRR